MRTMKQKMKLWQTKCKSAIGQAKNNLRNIFQVFTPMLIARTLREILITELFLGED